MPEKIPAMRYFSRAALRREEVMSRTLTCVGRTLLSAAVVFRFALKATSVQMFRADPHREGHDFQSCRNQCRKGEASAAGVSSQEHTSAAKSRILHGSLSARVELVPFPVRDSPTSLP